ncbi:MAG: phospholipid carrier-dependent glycosyltransferase, partial [Ruminiclostridium sp.]|nr:phospholipid carrier-dependent glycosyltransferase [Ruminiclostridium sp.]
AYAENINLAANPGFEEFDGSDPFYWTSGSWQNDGAFTLDTAAAHSGKSSALIINNKATDSRFKQEIKVKSNTYYRLSCWIKTEDVGSKTIGANLSIDGLLPTSQDVKGTSEDWTYIELFGITGKDQKSFTLTLGLGGYGSLNTGKAWFDDVVVEELEGKPAIGNVVYLFKPETSKIDPEKGILSTAPSVNPIFILSLLIVLMIPGIILYLKYKKNQMNGGNKIAPAKQAGRPSTISKELPGLKAVKTKLDKKDFIIMAAMTVIYILISVPNLGYPTAPETSWTPDNTGESFVVDLGKEANLARIYYYGGLGHDRPDTGKYRIQYDDGTGKFLQLGTITKNIGDIFSWKFIATPNIKTRYLKVIVDAPGATMNEFSVFEQGSTIPLKGLAVKEKNVADTGKGRPEYLFDEPEKTDYKRSYMSGMIFDEIYHARTAFEFLNGMQPYEWTHPPLGKILISLGIALFGMNPFGWRIVGTLFGAAMIPIMYLFGRKLFGRKFYAFCTAFLMMFDFMHFGLTRIATIDVYGTFFIILMYYFMYDYFANKSYVLGFRQSLMPLFLSGLFFGLGAASKWIGLYAGGGLAFLFFLTKYHEYRDYKSLSGKKAKAPSWVKDFKPYYLYRTLLLCILFFVIIPGIIYSLSYIPFINVTGGEKDLGLILRNQSDMFRYHSRDVLNATHPFSSFWWEWPLIRRPLESYLGTDLPAGMSSSMTIMGNPAIWWAGIAAVIAAVILAVKRKDRKMIAVFTAIAFQYLPWVGVSRIVFIYHFFSTVPFMILSIVYVIKALLEKYPEMKTLVYTYLILVFVLFIMFYPVLSGLEVPRWYVQAFLLWFNGKWVF